MKFLTIVIAVLDGVALGGLAVVTLGLGAARLFRGGGPSLANGANLPAAVQP